MAKKGGTPENLRKITSDEARVIGKKGGIASAQKRREKKERLITMKEAAEMILSLKLEGKEKQKVQNLGVSDDFCTWAVAVVIGLVKKAATGDPGATRLLREILGENVSTNEIKEKIVRIVDDV